MTDRFIIVSLTSRDVSARARLLDAEAPRTAAAVWDALPLGGQVFHGKFARNEIYTLAPAFAAHEPGPENTTVTPIPGDLCYFTFDGVLDNPAYGYESDAAPSEHSLLIDLAVFYGRNNLLVNGDVGWVPGNVFATITDGLVEFAAACNDIWMGGARGETLTFARA
ncbi:DUF3830 family protein [Gordonia sp. w5E2]|uniref:DUF3830 family protein n=1 Tax=Gordonia jacobaea TaxID=122202 RepID=A0ABR5I9U4_9ACTN|nr:MULTISPECIES: DUF3830 family protein [Gordonia]SKY81653.1 Protein of uncharacterised function (DUF3830) [Mycobacteroides abscessus subsp. abscessus]KNA90427.1 hypothetical protein ABW18_16210 [Gordonia jacobaea]OBC03279.1 hypothetical protein A5785_15640 [Gordonia sp. 852002-50395_SCH5434458]OBC12348.1 hypothetical protein A5788_21315 [Gordonia sp. 852002-50816_SCH5313054-c]OBC20780.1 hypothetical protein A5786_15830 [Gordonia sp. 852002-50816_SCH5313054-a]